MSDATRSARAYLFEAKGIQRYIFDSGQLRDVIGASDLVAGLCATDGDGDLLGHVVGATGETFTFSRRASGAFCALGDPAALDRLRALWRLAFAITRPGLEGVDGPPADGSNEVEAIKNAYRRNSGARFNSAAELPPSGHPFLEFAARTGRVATALQVYPEPGGAGQVSSNGVHVLDVMTEPQRRWADAETRHGGGPSERVLAANASKAYVFARNLDPREADKERNPVFPFRGDDRRIAIVHADLSGLGETFMKVTDKANSAAQVHAVATAIETAVTKAAQTAFSEEALPFAKARSERKDGREVVPARPVVIGGDDLTFLVRADIALPFARTLLERLEAETRAELASVRIEAKLPAEVELPTSLSACAGVAIVGASHPFLLADHLAESLCSFAKKAAKAAWDEVKNKPGVAVQLVRNNAKYPSLLAFYAATTALEESYDEIVERELRVDGTQLMANPYLVGNWPANLVPKATRWQDLEDLAQALAQAPRGSGKIIEALALLRTDPSGAERMWKRWAEVAVSDEEKDAVEALAKALGTDTIAGLRQVNFTDWAGLLSDALEAVDVGTYDAEGGA